MRIVILASDNPVSTYLAHEVGRRQTVDAIVCPTRTIHRSKAKPWPKPGIGTVTRLGEAIQGKFFARHHRRLQQAISQQLFGHVRWPALEATHEIPSRIINGLKSVQLFTSLEPDILIVCGARRFLLRRSSLFPA